MRASALPASPLLHADRRARATTLSLVALATLGAACTPPPLPPKPGAHDQGAWLAAGAATPTTASASASPRSSAAPAPPKPRERWEPFATLSTLRPAAPRAPSQHFAGAHDGEVVTNAAAAAYPTLGPRSDLPVGSMIVETHRSRGRDDIVAHLVMTKRSPGFDPRGGDWEYAVVTATGEIEDRGPLPTCARCHAEAPHDRLFGPPRR